MARNNLSKLKSIFKGLKKNVYEVDQELGGRELSISACPRWEIDLQERKEIQIPGGMPGGAWLQVKLNHA